MRLPFSKGAQGGWPSFPVCLSRSGTVGAPSLRCLQGRAAMLSVQFLVSCRVACIALTVPITCTLSPVRATGDCPFWAPRAAAIGAGAAIVSISWTRAGRFRFGIAWRKRAGRASVRTPALRTEREGRGTHYVADAGEIKSPAGAPAGETWEKPGDRLSVPRFCRDCPVAQNRVLMTACRSRMHLFLLSWRRSVSVT
jgi:hypothetical protein